MGKKIRITRKQLKEDEVASFWNSVLHWVHENQKAVLIGVIAVAVLFIFVSAYKRRSVGRRAQANMVLMEAMADIQGGLIAQDPSAGKQRFEDARSKLETVLDLHKGSKVAVEAIYLLGNIAFFLNNYDEAEQMYLRYLDMAKGPIAKAQGHIALGYTFENKFFWQQDSGNRGLLDRAEESYLEAEQLTSGTMERYVAMLGRARLYDLQPAKAGEAKKLYAQIARERKLDTADEPQDKPYSSFYEVMLDRMKRSTRLFSLAETAQFRLERLEAEY